MSRANNVKYNKNRCISEFTHFRQDVAKLNIGKISQPFASMLRAIAAVGPFLFGR
jgi:hypothetical protein